MNENTTDSIKNISIENTGGLPCFARVKIIMLPNSGVSVRENNDWQYRDDGYWYYKNEINSGESTKNLEISENNEKIVVIGETTEVLYSESGAAYADWSMTCQ